MYLIAVLILPSTIFAAAPGSLDPTFGKFGKVITDFQSGAYTLSTLIQPDGKILVAGTINSQTTNDDFLLLRYNADGSPDNAFGTNGKVMTDFSNGHDRVFGSGIQADGKIVVVGYTTITGFTDTAIARYMPDGSLDNSFDSDGRVVFSIGGSGNVGDGLSCVAFQADGKIVAGGYAADDFAVLRLNLDGSLDTSFNTNGYTITPIAAGGDFIKSIIIQPDRKIIAGGSGGSDFVITRYNADGTLDASFGAAGIVRTDFDGYSDLNALTMQSDGKFVAAGITIQNQYNSAVARFNPNGVLDTSFGNGGKVITNVNPNGADIASDVVVQSDGKIIVSGYEGEAGSWKFSVIRYQTNGDLDMAFGNKGIVRTEFGTDAVAIASVLYGDKLLVLGNSFLQSGVKLARYNLSVTPSSSSDFDGDGFPDYAVFRPVNGTWYILHSGDSTIRFRQFGIDGDVPLNGDFDGDQKTDFAIFRPGLQQWWVNKSSTDETVAIQFGQTGDKPVVSDYDKDGKSDVAVWRPADGNWFVLRSSDDFSSYFSFPFGQNGDIPIQSANSP